MKLGKTVLLEIVNIVQEGLTKGVDISQRLRDLDLSVSPGSRVDQSEDTLELSKDYIKARNSDPDSF